MSINSLKTYILYIVLFKTLQNVVRSILSAVGPIFCGYTLEVLIWGYSFTLKT